MARSAENERKGKDRASISPSTYYSVCIFAGAWRETGWTVINLRVERHPRLAAVQFITRFGFALTIKGWRQGGRQKGMKKPAPPLLPPRYTRSKENNGTGRKHNYMKKTKDGKVEAESSLDKLWMFMQARCLEICKICKIQGVWYNVILVARER